MSNAKRDRKNETVCKCDAYSFPHREGGGKCDPEERAREEEEAARTCSSCGGSGGGDYPCHCPACGGTGESRAWRMANRLARRSSYADEYDFWGSSCSRDDY